MLKAISSAECDDTILVGDDTDLLVLLIHYMITKEPPKNIWMLRLASGDIVNVKELIRKIPQPLAQNILFIHAASGCDTVSSFSGIGKTKLFKLLLNKPQLIQELGINVFTASATVENTTLYKVGFDILSRLYDASGKAQSWDALRSRVYNRKLKGKRAVKLQSLPPTTASANEHVLRIKLTIDQWLGREDIVPEGRGWLLTENGYVPVQGHMNVCPREILEFISCKCTTDCSRRQCSCKTAGLSCTEACQCDEELCVRREQVDSIDHDFDDSDNDADASEE